MGSARLSLSREHILALRRHRSHLNSRLPFSGDSLRHAAYGGLTDSMPRAALLSLHARVNSVAPSSWEDPALVQVWGPRFSTYAVAADDWAPFTLGRMPRSGRRRAMANESLARLANILGDDRMEYSAAGRAMGVDPNSLRYATLTGRVMIRWEGSGKPLIWVVDAPPVPEEEARRELARRYLFVFGVGNVAGFGQWAGVNSTQADLTFAELAPELMPVTTPLGDAMAMAAYEHDLRPSDRPSDTVRLLPSGDTYYLLHGAERKLLVPDATKRPRLWTSRVWPGAVVVGNEVVGTWRRRKGNVSISEWRDLTKAERSAIQGEAEAFPLVEAPISVEWE